MNQLACRAHGSPQGLNTIRTGFVCDTGENQFPQRWVGHGLALGMEGQVETRPGSGSQRFRIPGLKKLQPSRPLCLAGAMNSRLKYERKSSRLAEHSFAVLLGKVLESNIVAQTAPLH